MDSTFMDTEVMQALDTRLQEEGITTIRDLAAIHDAITAEVGACDLTGDKPDGRNDPSVIPLWLPEALAETIRRLGFEVTEDKEEGEGLIGTHWHMLQLGPITMAAGGTIQIVPGLSVASKARILCHELVHCMTGPDAPTGDPVQDTVEHVGREIIAEATAVLVMTTLGAGDNTFSIFRLADWTAVGDPTGDAEVMGMSGPHAVLMAGTILLGIQAWQDYQAREIVGITEEQ